MLVTTAAIGIAEVEEGVEPVRRVMVVQVTSSLV